MRKPELIDLDGEIMRLHDVALADKEDIDIYYKGKDISHDRIAVVDTDNLVELGTHKKGYTLIKHKDVLKAVKDLWGNLIQGACGTYNRGRGLYLYIYPSEWREAINELDEDYMQIGIRIKNSYDGSAALNLSVVAIRVICTNGIYMDKIGKQSYRRHTANMGDLEEFKEDLVEMKGMDVSDVIEVFREANNLELDVENTIKALKLPQSLQDEVIEEIEHERETAWEIHDMITRKLTHGYGNNDGEDSLSEGTLERYHREANRVLQPDVIEEVASQ